MCTAVNGPTSLARYPSLHVLRRQCREQDADELAEDGGWEASWPDPGLRKEERTVCAPQGNGASIYTAAREGEGHTCGHTCPSSEGARGLGADQ